MRREISGGIDPWNVQVHLGDSEVLTDSAGKYTSYQFRFQFGTELHIFKARYSVLWKFNERLTNEYSWPNASPIPKFPPKTWLRDMTKPKNYTKRAEELHVFLKELIQNAGFLKWAPFHELLNLSPELKTKIIEIADSMMSKKKVIENFKQEPEKKGSDSRDTDDPPPPCPKEMSDDAKELLDKQLKEILQWAGESFMSAERGMYENGYDGETGEDSNRKDLYAEALRGNENCPPFRPNKDFEKREKPDIEDFVSQIDGLLTNFEIDLFPEIAKPASTPPAS